MPQILFWASYVALWLTVLAVVLGVFVLYRYEGMRLVNSSRGRAEQGPDVGASLPRLRLQDRVGGTIDLASGGLAQFVFVASSECEPCKKVRSSLGAFSQRYAGLIDVVLVCRGVTREQIDDFATVLPSTVRVVDDIGGTISTQLRVATTPFAFIADSLGVVRGKGAPASTESFDWFAAQVQVPAPHAAVDAREAVPGIRDVVAA